MQAGTAAARFGLRELRQRAISAVDRVAVYPGGEGRAHWSQHARGETFALVDARITDKNGKLPGYRERHRELQAFWLLLVSGHGIGDPDWDVVQSANAKSEYARVFFLQHGYETAVVYELQPTV